MRLVSSAHNVKVYILYMTIREIWTTKKKVSNRRRILRRIGWQVGGESEDKILKLQLVRLI